MEEFARNERMANPFKERFLAYHQESGKPVTLPGWRRILMNEEFQTFNHRLRTPGKPKLPAVHWAMGRDRLQNQL